MNGQQIKTKPVVICSERTYWAKQLTEVPNIFSRSSMCQETLNHSKEPMCKNIRASRWTS